MHFVKMEGCGNDYIYLDGEKEAISNPQALARKISDRHFGVGADGMILICPSDMATAGWRCIMRTVPGAVCVETAYAVWHDICTTINR